MGKIRDFNWVLYNGHFDKLSYGNGPNIFIVDTRVFIDLDKFYFDNGQNVEHPASLLDGLEQPLFITSGVLGEIKRHSEEIRVNRRPEISQPTSILVYELFGESVDFLKTSGIENLSSSQLDEDRYRVYCAASKAFKSDYRKGEKDKISEVDKEIISMALHLTLGNYRGEPIDAVNILSPDTHNSKTVNFLKSGNYDLGDRVIRAIPTRNDLRSYLRK